MSDPRVQDRRRAERGTSLFEVTLALGLMGAVLGSIVGLFTLGAGGVRSGRRASEALAVAQTIVEDMQGWSRERLYGQFGADGQANSYLFDTESNAGGAAWQSALGQALPTAHATISLASLEPSAPKLSESQQIRIVVTILWQEGARSRKIRLATVRS